MHKSRAGQFHEAEAVDGQRFTGWGGGCFGKEEEEEEEEKK